MTSSVSSLSPAQWTTTPDSDLTIPLVHATLDPISDDLWVAAACLERQLNDAPLQEALIRIGLSRTDATVERCKNIMHTSSSDSSDTKRDSSPLHEHFQTSPIDAQLCEIRVLLLKRLDRLNTYVEICKCAPDEDGSTNVMAEDGWEDDPWADAENEAPSPAPQQAAKSPPVPLTQFLSDPLHFSSFRLASSEWLGAISVIYARHAEEIWPYRLQILGSIPEHTNPSEFYDLLLAYSASEDREAPFSFKEFRARDWSEEHPVGDVANTSWISERSDGRRKEIRFPKRDEPLSGNELSQWYKDRANHVIEVTGLVDVALATIQRGASQGIPGLDEFGEDLSLLSRLVYDAPQGENMDSDWTLTRWKAMDPHQVIHAYTQHSTPESLSHDISHLVMPYLFVLESRAERAGTPDPTLPTRLFYDYVLSAPLEMVAAIFEASKPTLPIAKRLIRNDEDIARLALACLYGSDSLDQWSTMSRIFECLPAWNLPQDEDEDEDAADTTLGSLGTFVKPTTLRPRCTPSDLLVFFTPLPTSALSRTLDILDVHLESGEIFSRWSVAAPLRWFLQSHSDVNEQRAWATRMARRAGGADDKLSSLEDWEWLLEDMQKLTNTGENGLRGALGLLSQEEVTSIFFGGLLSSGNFTVAQAILHSPKTRIKLDPIGVEEICLACSKEFYDNASSGNYKFGEMKLAYDCLSVPSQTDRIIREKEFVEATSRLSSFNIMSRPGIPISPIEIRLTKDRLSLVARVLASNNDAYKHTEVILDLVHKLGFRDDNSAKVKTLAMLADAALQAEDFSRAYEINQQMVQTVLSLRTSPPPGTTDEQIQEVSEVCWVACFQLGRQPEFDDLEKKLALMGRALELCPPDKLHDVLTAWRRLDKEDLTFREERLAASREGRPAAPRSRQDASAFPTAAASLRARLQDFHMPSPPMLSTPDAAALASRTFRSVAANFPFSVGSRGRSLASESSDGGRANSSSRSRIDGEDVSAQATRAFQKGIGWLIGVDDE